jgi:hypothetical protein
LIDGYTAVSSKSLPFTLVKLELPLDGRPSVFGNPTIQSIELLSLVNANVREKRSWDWLSQKVFLDLGYYHRQRTSHVIS